MSSGVKGGASRVSIPSGVKKTIENIKEFTGQNHSEDEIYAMLKECSMDPNEAIQKLILIDTFHEVKRNCDRRKENQNKEPAEKWKPGTQTRPNRVGGRGNYPSRYVPHVTMAENSSKDLLELEAKPGVVSSASTLESKLFVCKKDFPFPASDASRQKPTMAPLPKSQFLGKVKDFLGVLSESNKKLMDDAKERPDSYDIEVISGDESKYIEMDLMLGIADLHTPEAVAAAESAMAGYQPPVRMAESSSGSEDEDSSDDEDDAEEDGNHEQDTEAGSESVKLGSKVGDSSCQESKKQKPKKRPKIVELA